MNTRTVKYAIVAVLLAVFITVSLMTSTQVSNHVVIETPVSNIASLQPANSILFDAPTLVLTNPQPQVTRPAPYIPESEPSEVELPSQPVAGQVVIQFEPETTDAERQEYIESIGGTVVESIDSLDTVIINVSEETATQPLPESAKVAASEPDYYVTALDDLAPVNDPRYTEQWALPAIGAPSAWAELPADAPKVTVAVIDSGICASHPDLAGRILDGWDFLENDSTPQDDFGHGCSVSGVIAANMNDGIGIAGVAPNAQIMPLRVLNASGVGSYSDVAAAIVYAADNGAQVINLSLGGSNPSSTLENAVNYAISKGVIVVAAAGNSGVEGALYPAAYPDVIAVGSVDPNLQHSSFSNYGSQIDIWAPGRDILTTKRDGSYGMVSGTSFAAPYVAGAEAVEQALGQTVTLGNVLILSLQITDIAPTPELPTSTITATPTSTETQVSSILHPIGQNFLPSEIEFGPSNDIFQSQNYFATIHSNLENISVITSTGKKKPSEIIDEVALLYGINPRVIIALIESQTGIVNSTEMPTNVQIINPLGLDEGGQLKISGFEGQINWIGYFLRSELQARENISDHTSVKFSNDETSLVDFDVPSGDYVIMSIVGRMGTSEQWQFQYDDFINTYRALFPVGKSLDITSQASLPAIKLPFAGTNRYTSGPHGSGVCTATNLDAPAIDFAARTAGQSFEVLNVGSGILKNVAFIEDTNPATIDYGWTVSVALDNSGGLTVHYMHLNLSAADISRLQALKNQAVPQGYFIGNTGNTGGQSSVHLHLELRTGGTTFDSYATLGSRFGWDGNQIDGWTIRIHRIGQNGATGYGYQGSAIRGNNKWVLLDGYCGSGATSWSNVGTNYNRTTEVNGIDSDTIFADIGTLSTITSSNTKNTNGGGGGTTEQCSNYSFNGITLFNDIECRGTAVQINSTGFRNLDSSNNFNDQTRSINVASNNWSVRIWAHNDRGEPTQCITGDKWDLSKSTDTYTNGQRIYGDGVNISSIEVFQNSNCTSASLVDNADFIGQSSYLTVDPGQNFSIYFEVRNSGTSTWQTGSYLLQNLETSLGAGSQQGLGSNVGPNGTKRWDINMTAPSTPGTYRTSWMVNHNGTNFGPYMFIDVTVRQPSTCSQLAYEVRLYDQINCPSTAGKVTNGGTGLWDISSSFNDRAQSIEVPLGYSARLYKDNTESSPSVCIDNSDVTLRDNTFSDGSAVASSTGAGATWVRIYNQDRCPASAPVTPVNFRQSGSTLNSLTIAWDDVTNETGYKIYEWNGASFVYLASVGANQTTYTDTRYGCGRDQFYEVSAYNNAGESEHAGWFHAYTQPCPTVANDDFNNAILIGGAPYNNTQTTAYATEAGDDPLLNCEFFSANKFNTVWYRYTPNASGTLTVNTFGSGYDTVLGIWTGLRGSLQQQGCNDDVEAGNNKSQLITSVTSGTTYYFEIAGYSAGDEGALALSVNLDAKPNPPTLVSPTILPILNSRTVTFNWNASSSSNVTGYVFRLSQYSNPNTQPWLVSITTSALTNMYTFPSDGQFYWHVQSTSTNQNSDWVSQVFGIDSAAPTVAIMAPASSSFLGTNQITITASASDTLSGMKNLVFFVGYDSVAGAGALVKDNSSQSYALPLENPDDLESQGSNVTSQAWSWLQLGSDTNGSNGWSMTWDASTVPDQANVAFYVYAYDSAGNVQGTGNWGVVLDRTSPISNLNWLPTYSSPSFNVSWGGSDTLTGIDSFDIQYQDNGGAWTNWLSATTSSSATFNGTASHTYTFRSRARDGAGNTSTYPVAAEIQTTVVVSPLNDNFNAAQVISALPLINPSLDTRGASTASDDPILPTNCSNLSSKHSNSVWYKYTTPANGLLEIGTWGSDYDTVLAVWTGTVGNLSLIQCNDDLYGYMQAWLQEVPVSAGIIYYIEVMDYGNPSGGDLQLYVDFAQSPTNDDFNSAPLVTLNPFNATLDTRGTTQALDDPGLTSCNRNPGRNSVWYKYIPTWNGELQLDTKGSNYDTLLAVWTGARGSLISIGCNDDIGDVNGTWDSDSILTVPVTVGATYYIEVSTFNGLIDINGASATELVEKPDEIESATSLEDIKEQLENGTGSMSGLQESDLSAQFWGGQMHLNISFSHADAYESDNDFSTAVTINPGNTQSHSIFPAGDHDNVKFTITSPSSILLETSGLNGYDTEMALYDSSHNLIGYDNDGGSFLYSRLERTCGDPLPAGAYNLMIYNYVGVVPEYQLAFSAESCIPPTTFNKTSPANDTVDVALSPTLFWDASNGATSYEYCFDTTNDNSCSSWINNGSSTSKALSNLSANNTYYWQVRANNTRGTTYANNGIWWSFATVRDTTPPTALSITRLSPTPTNTTSVGFTVTFSESVTGVDAGDFTLTTTGVSGVAVSGISGSDSIYTITVNTGIGSGTIRLDVVNDGTIKDAALNALGAGFTSGESYTLDKSATFADVPLTYWANSYIERLFNAGITGGCSVTPLNYCPDSTVTRAQMAIFLLKGIHNSSYAPPAINGSTGFTDVATDYWAAAWIKQLATEGITSGCGVGIYCPDATVTRAQMAVFLLKAKNGSSYSPPAVGASTGFNDVAKDYWAAPFIKQLVVDGITSGCDSNIYCPDSDVTRAQMAIFLVKTFNLP